MEVMIGFACNLNIISYVFWQVQLLRKVSNSFIISEGEWQAFLNFLIQ